MIEAVVNLFLTFAKIGFVGFGGGYAMMTLIMSEMDKLNITLEQFADLNALDMVVPGPIMINAATYVGYLNSGFWGALAATVAVVIPSFVYVPIVMRSIERYRQNHLMNDVLSGIKPAAVGLIAAAAISIGYAVIVPEGEFVWGLAVIVPGLVFIGTAVANIKFNINPILLTVIAGILGAVLL